MSRLLRVGAPLGDGRAHRVFSRGLDALAAAALAPACAACARPLETASRGCVCEPCWTAARQTPPPPWSDPFIAIGLAAGRYEGALRDIIHAHKYDGRRSLAGPLSRLVASAGAEMLRDADAVVPVPLHPWKRLSRGFNQTADLARGLGLPVAHALLRWRATRPQVALPAWSRRANLRGAFVRAPWAPALDGCVVVLVDDVRTTGATLAACAEALRGARVRETRALTVAIADLRT